jgi:hypothetical protein
MGPVKVLGRAVQKVADSIMMTLIGNDAMYIYNVSWVFPAASRLPACSALAMARASRFHRGSASERAPASLTSASRARRGYIWHAR